jgi:hypothetical protein
MQEGQDFHKPLIAVGLSFFEDASCLPHSLSSFLDNDELRPYIKILACDGVYKGYPIDHPLSEDGSRQIIQTLQEEHGPDKIELYDFPNLHERFKRQKYVDIAAKQEIPFLLIVDADERVECKNIPAFLDELKMIQDVWVDREKVLLAANRDNDKMIPYASNVYHIKFADLDGLGYIINAASRPRLWFRPQDMRYTTHSFFRATQDDKGELFDPSQQFTRLFVIQNMQMFHDHSCRSQDREDRRRYYEVEQLPRLERAAAAGTTSTGST